MPVDDRYQHRDDEDGSHSINNQQQQQTAEFNSHSEDSSYSTDFSSDSSSDDDEYKEFQTQEPASYIQEPSQRITVLDRQAKAGPETSAAVVNTEEPDHWNTKNTPAASSFSCAKEHSTIKSPASDGLGRCEESPTKSGAKQRSERLRHDPNADPGSRSKEKSGRHVGRNWSLTAGKAGSSQRREKSQTDADRNRKSSPQRRRNSKKNDEDGNGNGSKSSSLSSLSSPSHSPLPQRAESHGLVRTNATQNDHHLKHTDNDSIRQWLQLKNSQLKQRKKEKRRLERSRRRQLQEEQRAKEERRKESEILVQRWMEEKKMDRMLNKRQQQTPKTLEHSQQGRKPAEDQNGKKCELATHPGNLTGKRGSFLRPTNDQDGRSTCVVTDDKSKVPLFVWLEKHATGPTVSTRKTSGQRMYETETRKWHGDWARGGRNTGLSTADQGISLTAEDDQRHLTSVLPARRVPHPPPAAQGSEKARRCSSARVGRRRADQGRTSRSQAGRPLSNKPRRIGTRLEPQGADHRDPVSELNVGRAASTSKPEDAESAYSGGAKVGDVMGTAKKDDCCSHTVPNVHHELEDEKKTSPDPSVIETRDVHLEKVPEGENSTVEDRPCLGPMTRSSRDLQNVIKSESAPPMADTASQNSTSNSNRDDRQPSPSATCQTVEEQEQTQERRQQETEDRHCREDGQGQKTDMAIEDLEYVVTK